MSVDSHVSQPSEQSAGCLLVKIFCRRLDNDFYSEIQKRVVEKASQKNLKLVVFAQDDLAEQKIFDYIYQYGTPKSINDGYYSLFYHGVVNRF